MDKQTVTDVWIDKYGRVRTTILFEKEQTFEMEIEDGPQVES